RDNSYVAQSNRDRQSLQRISKIELLAMLRMIVKRVMMENRFNVRARNDNDQISSEIRWGG
ncbi:unnamed protein product, partial [marine sediment metagenome]